MGRPAGRDVGRQPDGDRQRPLGARAEERRRLRPGLARPVRFFDQRLQGRGAANRVGTERVEGLEQSFYGRSFVADFTGTKIAEANRTEETVLVAELDLDRARSFRAGMGFFRDRRPDLYAPLLTSDGRTSR